MTPVLHMPTNMGEILLLPYMIKSHPQLSKTVWKACRSNYTEHDFRPIDREVKRFSLLTSSLLTFEILCVDLCTFLLEGRQQTLETPMSGYSTRPKPMSVNF